MDLATSKHRNRLKQLVVILVNARNVSNVISVLITATMFLHLKLFFNYVVIFEVAINKEQLNFDCLCFGTILAARLRSRQCDLIIDYSLYF